MFLGLEFLMYNSNGNDKPLIMCNVGTWQAKVIIKYSWPIYTHFNLNLKQI